MCGRRGTWRHHRPSLCVVGVALMVLGWLWWRAGLRGRRGAWRHRPSFCVAGVALGDIDLHFAWQAWQLWRWAGSGSALGSCLAPLSPRRFAWQAWLLATSTFTLRGRRVFWLCAPGLLLLLLLLLPPSPPQTTFPHTTSPHTHTHNFLTHNLLAHNLLTHTHTCGLPTHNYTTYSKPQPKRAVGKTGRLQRQSRCDLGKQSGPGAERAARALGNHVAGSKIDCACTINEGRHAGRAKNEMMSIPRRRARLDWCHHHSLALVTNLVEV